jgi:VWFA-related protein
MFALDVEVTDAAGNPVPNLVAQDFTLLDNGQPTRIFTFTASAGSADGSDTSPLLILVFDELNLSAQQLSQARHAAAAFLREGGGRLAQPVFLYRITSDGLFSSSQSSLDGNELAEQVEKKKAPRAVWRGGGTSLATLLPMEFEALRRLPPIRALGSVAIDQRSVPGRKTLVWIGNGWPVSAGSQYSFDEATELSTRLREARITVNMVSAWPDPESGFDYHDYLAPVETTRELQPARLALPVIATHTGGLVLHVSNDSNNDLKGAIERCAREVLAFYSITFDPQHTDHVDEYHELAVVVSRPVLTARTVTGYYNQPVYFDHPKPNLELVTVGQLEEAVRKAAEDIDFAQRLGNMELTERLTNEKRANLLELVHKDKEREALTVLADASEFLTPPPGAAPPDPVPDRNAQLQILKSTFDFLANSIPKLPDFFATRFTATFEEPKVRDDQSWKVPLPDQTLHLAYTSRGTVLYRNGAEVVDAESSRRKKEKGREHGLDTRGTFGPVLASVLVAAAKGQSSVSWSRWEWSERAIFAGPALQVRPSAKDETSERRKLAVFHFAIPPATPLFEVSYCCLPEGNGTRIYRNMTGYHGEFAVDPSSGAVMRLAIEADLDEDRDPKAPIIRSGLMVEYGEMQIAGKPYICPTRSVSLSRGRTLRELYEWGMNFIVYAPFETMVDDFTFGEYHKFGSESHMLSGFEEIPDTNPPKSGAGEQPAKPQ